MASTPTRLMTFSEFEQLPTPPDGRLELRHGEVFKLPPAKFKHFRIQQKLRDLLQESAGDTGKVSTEFGFRTQADGDYRIPDVAYTSKERWATQDPEAYFLDAPDLVIEILSPSNTAAEMRDKRKLCLENGSQEFWLVDIEAREIEVYTRDGHFTTYKSGQEIPLFFGGSLSVGAIFG